jgi:ABC-type uncharacterized transport system permease subunit
MTQAVQVIRASRSRKDVAIGVLFLALAALVLIYLPQGTAGMDSTFVLTSQRAGVTIAAPDIVVPTAYSLYALGALAALAGGWQLARGFKRANGAIVGVALLVIIAFLVWATQDKSLNLTGMLVSSLVRATPIGLAALSGIYSERSGVVNIGIEGMMLAGSFTSVIFASLTDNMLVGVLAGILAGVLLGALHAVLSIRYKVNQIISGTGIIIPGLWQIPVLGPILFNQSPLIYAMFILLAGTHILLYYTRWGLRVRAVGEHPRAADTLGINVFRVRYISVLLSGAVAGLAGAYMCIGAAGRFNEGMSAGKGFLGLAAMIFGNWNPAGAFLGSLIFGFFDSWQEKLSILQVGVPVDLLGMAPYIATMVVLAGIVGRARMPAADGTPYEKQ